MRFLVGPAIWARIGELARRPGRGLVAVPYFGKGAAKMLPLKRGSVLVTRFEPSAVRAGQVCPDDVIALLKEDVRIFNEPALHAKVYVFPSSIVIGSSNASETSRDRLIEACIESNDPKMRRAAERFVLRHARDEVDLESARRLRKQYREPRVFPMARGAISSGKRASVRRDELSQRPLWLVPLYPLKRTSLEYDAAERAAVSDARKALLEGGDMTVHSFRWSTDVRERLQVGDSVLVRYRDKSLGVDLLEPPAKVLSVRKERGKHAFAVAYAWRKRARARSTMRVMRRLGEQANAVLTLKFAIKLASAEARERLLALWAP